MFTALRSSTEHSFRVSTRLTCGTLQAMRSLVCVPTSASLLLLLALSAGTLGAGTLSAGCGDASGGADAGASEADADGGIDSGADAAETSGTDVPESSGPLPCLPCTSAELYEYKGDGIYLVPLAPENDDLAEAAVTIVQEAQLHVSEGEVVLEYDLPAELTGVVQQVELEGDLPEGTDPLILSGSAGTATCYLDNFQEGAFDIYCLEELPGVAIDRAALEVLLESRGLDQDVVKAHLDVTDLFIEDPIGILEATLTYSGTGAD